MAQQRRNDKYSNIVSARTNQTGADAITFNEVRTGISLGSGIGMVIDQIDYFVRDETFHMINSVGDTLIGAWTVSAAITAMDNEEIATDNRIIHACKMSPEVIKGTVSSGVKLEIFPKVYQFFPGIIVAAPRLYFGVDSDSLSAAGTMASRMYFRYVELTPQEYLELAEAFILVG